MTLRRTLVCLIAPALALACDPPPEGPLTPVEQEVIGLTVAHLFDGIAEATSDLDLDRLLAYYRESDDLTYVANGTISRSYETQREMVMAQFGGLTDSRLEWGSTYVDVLSREVAVVTATYDFEATLPSGRSVGSQGTFTCVYLLADGRWQIQHSSHTFPPAAG